MMHIYLSNDKSHLLNSVCIYFKNFSAHFIFLFQPEVNHSLGRLNQQNLFYKLHDYKIIYHI